MRGTGVWFPDYLHIAYGRMNSLWYTSFILRKINELAERFIEGRMMDYDKPCR
jgi:hypothetical protein